MQNANAQIRRRVDAFGRAKRGASGALYLQSAIAGLNSRLRSPAEKIWLSWIPEGSGPMQCRSTNPARSGRKQR
jgi:hypothetical protein